MLKFTCEKTPLFSAVAVASRTVAQKSPISVLEGIHLRAEQDTLSLTGYDLENGITEGAVLGGSAAVSDESGKIVFGME